MKTISEAFLTKYSTTYLYGAVYAIRNVNSQTFVDYYKLFNNSLSVSGQIQELKVIHSCACIWNMNVRMLWSLPRPLILNDNFMYILYSIVPV